MAKAKIRFDSDKPRVVDVRTPEWRAWEQNLETARRYQLIAAMNYNMFDFHRNLGRYYPALMELATKHYAMARKLMRIE